MHGISIAAKNLHFFYKRQAEFNIAAWPLYIDAAGGICIAACHVHSILEVAGGFFKAGG